MAFDNETLMKARAAAKAASDELRARNTVKDTAEFDAAKKPKPRAKRASVAAPVMAAPRPVAPAPAPVPWMREHVIDPAWVKATPSTARAPVEDPITTISNHLEKLLPIAFHADRLLPGGDKKIPSGEGYPKGSRTATIDGRAYAFSSDVDQWIEGLENFLSAIVDTLHQSGFIPSENPTPEMVKIRDAIGGIPANVKDAKYAIMPEKLLTHLVEDVRTMMKTHLAALHSTIGDVLCDDAVADQMETYANHQQLTGDWDVSYEVLANMETDEDPPAVDVNTMLLLFEKLCHDDRQEFLTKTEKVRPLHPAFM